MKIRTIAGTALLLVAVASVAGAQDITKQVRSETAHKANKQSFVDCAMTRSKDTFERELGRLGWAKPRPPALDWTREVAVIVSPSKFSNQTFLALASATIDAGSGRLNVSWRLKPIPPPINDANSISFGSSSPPGPEVLVVAIPSATISGTSVSCSQVP